ncbi:LysR family transcriptional regulator [Acinetobacter boissieri]|uniref:Transcriptional regulator /transcriptional regulator, LysR family n=1 Tax=Acinetobacter boissieri TaxID=1219383 RepID=A0A1G6HGA0_9GAMM|nr:LysR family transcriptional regulator [Acinetobacter boissieri]SDB93279.1 transcriptional regulator /transcriptional regulator, LysR family [Acinetobacter boissieri]
MRKTDHLGGIIAFVTTSQLGSFTAAAERLGLTKSAVGKSVKRLEDRLELNLFHRSSRRLSLTSDGEKFLKSCQTALDILENAEVELKSHTTKPSGRLRIDLPAAFGRKKILPLLLEMSSSYPELFLTVTFSERFIDPIEEGIDLFIRIGELVDSSGLVARQLTTQKLILCASPQYIALHGEPKKLEDIKNHKCIVGFNDNKPKVWLLKTEDFQTKRFVPPLIHEFGDGDAMLASVLAGVGISQLPKWLVSKYIASGELIEVLAKYSNAEIPINVLWPKGQQLLPRCRYVVDQLLKAAEHSVFD